MRSVVGILAGQAVAFGLSESLLLISANAIFLDAYGSKWLPLTYVGIADRRRTAGGRNREDPASLAVAAGRDRRRGWVGLLFVAAWAVLTVRAASGCRRHCSCSSRCCSRSASSSSAARPAACWTFSRSRAASPASSSGFARRLPRRAASPAGRCSPSWAAPITCCSSQPRRRSRSSPCSPSPDSGSPIGSRHVESRAHRTPAAAAPPGALDPLRAAPSSATRCSRRPARYLIEYVLFDRAAARYDDAASLTRFLSTYTALLNLVDILFLVLLAGVLLRRFGLRLGIAANPALVTLLGGGDARVGDRLRRRRRSPCSCSSRLRASSTSR